MLPALLAALMYFLVGASASNNQSAMLKAQAIAEAKANAVDSNFEIVTYQLEGLSRVSSLRSALNENDSVAIQSLAKDWALMFSYLNRFEILPLGELGVAGLGKDMSKLRNNIEKDIVQRSLNEKGLVVDTYVLDGVYVVSFAKAVTAGNRKVGALLLSLDTSWLLSRLENLQNERHSQSEATRLLYQLEGMQPKIILSDRELAENKVIATGMAPLKSNKNIKLRYDLSETTTGIDTVAVIVMGAFVVIALLGVLALVMARSAMTKLLVADSGKLKQYLAESFEGEPSKPEFEFSTFDTLAEGYLKIRQRYMDRRALKNTPPDLSVKSGDDSDWENPNLAAKIKVDTTEANTAVVENKDTNELTSIDIPEHIFRAYDIRGLADNDLNDENVRLIGAAIGTAAINAGNDQVAVARDGRLSSDRISSSLIEGLIAAGCDVVDIGVGPTPLLYFAVEHLKTQAGVMITGSHNPPEYNGFKVVIDGKALVDEQITALYETITHSNFASGQGDLSNEDMVDHYIDHIAEDVVFASPLKVVLDCGNGAASEIAPMLFASLGSEVVPMFAEIDGNFPNHLPDPGVAENLSALVTEVKQQQADLGLAFDGDADRVVAVSSSGEIISSDTLLMLFAKDVLTRNPGADIVYDIKCSRNLSQVISAQGGRPVMWRSGHSRIKQKMLETGALLGGEFSGHFCFKERWFGFDDGLYSGARLIEMLTLEGQTLDAMVAELPSSISSAEIDIPVDESSKFDVVDTLQNSNHFDGGEITSLDGVRVDYPDGWGLVRASNTSAKLTARFEAESQEELERIQTQFSSALAHIGLSLPL